MRRRRALRSFQERQNRCGQLEIDLGCDLDVERRPSTIGAPLTEGLDELAIVGDASARA